MQKLPQFFALASCLSCIGENGVMWLHYDEESVLFLCPWCGDRVKADRYGHDFSREQCHLSSCTAYLTQVVMSIGQ